MTEVLCEAPHQKNVGVEVFQPAAQTWRSTTKQKKEFKKRPYGAETLEWKQHFGKVVSITGVISPRCLRFSFRFC